MIEGIKLLASSSNSSSDSTNNVSNQNMPKIDRFFMSPFEKWKKYGRFPWKLVLHCTLIFVVTAQILVYNKQNSSYIRAAYRNWMYFFFQDAAKNSQYIYTVNETKKAVLSVADAYFSLNTTSVANYQYILNTYGMPEPLFLEISQLSNGKLVDSQFLLSKGDKRPFSDFSSYEKLVAFIQSIRHMRITVRVKDNERGPLYSDCFDWKIVILIKRIEGSQFYMDLDNVGVKNCNVDDLRLAFQDRFMWLNLLIITLGIQYLLLCIKAILRSINLFFKFRALPQDSTAWKIWLQLPFATKARFFTSWFLLSGFAILCCIVSCVWNIIGVVSHIPLSYKHNLIQALGCALLWISLVGFLEHNQRFYSVILTLRLGMPQVIRFLIGVLPIVVGYALFGMVCFGSRVESFKSFGSSLLTLFSVMNGDAILDTFDTLSSSFPILGQIYLYTFISLFMYIVLNVAIAIIEDAYFATLSYKRAMEMFQYLPQQRYNKNSAPIATFTFSKLLEVIEEMEKEDKKSASK